MKINKLRTISFMERMPPRRPMLVFLIKRCTYSGYSFEIMRHPTPSVMMIFRSRLSSRSVLGTPEPERMQLRPTLAFYERSSTRMSTRHPESTASTDSLRALAQWLDIFQSKHALCRAFQEPGSTITMPFVGDRPRRTTASTDRGRWTTRARSALHHLES
jgi:hypothetical protein